jgi:hypothetical protein
MQTAEVFRSQYSNQSTASEVSELLPPGSSSWPLPREDESVSPVVALLEPPVEDLVASTRPMRTSPDVVAGPYSIGGDGGDGGDSGRGDDGGACGDDAYWDDGSTFGEGSEVPRKPKRYTEI